MAVAALAAAVAVVMTQYEEDDDIDGNPGERQKEHHCTGTTNVIRQSTV